MATAATASSHIPTADALFSSLGNDSNNNGASFFDAPQPQQQQQQQTAAHPVAENPLMVHVQQLPTPRTSFSSGASSPPDNLSPSITAAANTPPQASPLRSLHSKHVHGQAGPQGNHGSHGSPSLAYLTPTSQLSSAAPSSSSTPTSQSPSTIASSSSSLRFPAPGSLSSSTTTTTTTTTSTTTRAPLFSTGLQQQHAQPIYPGQRSVSPSLSNGSPAPLRSSAALGPALYGSPSSTAPTSASIASTAVYNAPVQTSGTATMSTSQFTGAGIYNMGGAGPGSGGLGGRGGAFQAQQYNEHAQYQQELFYEDEREQLKKNARPAFNGSAPFLNKALHSAQQVFNGSGPMALPTQSGSSLPSIDARSGSIGSIGSTWASTMRLYEAAKLPLICLLWYLSSAVTNNIGKQIMNQFRYPVTLTFVQFVFVSLFCFFLGMAPGSTTRIQRPTRAIVQMTAPLVGFQVVGHVFSSIAISRVPLSVVHTIKALSPLFTVAFYRIILGTTYSRDVYMSLVPLMAGVMLACRLSLEFNNLVGLFCALTSTLVFVTQNVFTKKILSSSKAKPESSSSSSSSAGQRHGLGNSEGVRADPVEQVGGNTQKLDKINILFYSSTFAALSMIPIWLYAEGFTLMFADNLNSHHHSGGAMPSTWAICWLFFLNGVSHFFQNIFAFTVLALTSPVTYSIASLIKRIVVIVASIIYFHQTLGTIQWMGVCLTFWGLWLYNSAKNAAKVNPTAGILTGTKVGRRMSRSFGRGLLDSGASRKGGFNS